MKGLEEVMRCLEAFVAISPELKGQVALLRTVSDRCFGLLAVTQLKYDHNTNAHRQLVPSNIPDVKHLRSVAEGNEKVR